MLNTIQKYIDLCLIDEYADKDFRYHYSLDVDSLPQHEKNNFLQLLLEKDEILADMILNRMQELIEERLPIKELHDGYNRGFVPLLDQTSGDINWKKRGAA